MESKNNDGVAMREGMRYYKVKRHRTAKKTTTATTASALRVNVIKTQVKQGACAYVLQSASQLRSAETYTEFQIGQLLCDCKTQ